MNEILLRESIQQDCDELCCKLRDEDAAEIRAAGASCHEALLDGLEKGVECYSAVYAPTGEVLAMFGVSPAAIAGDRAVVWFLGSRRVDEFKFEYLRLGRRYVKYLLGRYKLVCNYCLAESEKSIRWLKLLGFVFRPERDLYSDGKHWLYFELEG